MKKNIFNFLVISISLIVLVAFTLSTQGIDTFVLQVSGLNSNWIAAALFLMFLYWLFEALATYVIAHFYGIRYNMVECFAVTMVGQFFNSITPFASGGQPAQVVYMMKRGTEAGDASSVVMIKFFVFQTVLTLYSAVIIVFSFTYFKTKIPLLFTMTFLGLAVHGSMIVLSILFARNRALTERILRFIFMLIKRLRFIKITDSTEKNVERSLQNFHDNAALLKNNPVLLLKTSILVALQITFFFAIPYCVCASFGVPKESFFIIFSATVFVVTIISIVPLPGASGGAEGGFYLFFGLFFKSSFLVTAILLWRLITYYSCIGLGSVFTIAFPKRTKTPY